MESLSRPPHRRKQSSSNTGPFASFSMKNPYEDVLFSGGGTKARPFGVHEYSEIFAGSSSSIPVLDLPGLDERVVSGECRSSKLDYSNIFGGLRDDDVALPYEELFNGVKKPKRSDDEPGILANARLPVQEPVSLHSSEKAKRSSGESADQSVDGVKQQFNLSFNKTNQKNNDVSKGKTHIAQLHAVPGFTYFIDGIQQMQRKEDDRRAPLLKREVSRTWSFSSDVEAIKARGGSSSDNSHTLDKSHIVPPPSSQPCNLREHNDSEGSRTSSFRTKNASGKIGSDSLPPLFEEEIDESSVAGVSAAALKKAIEQAQESIRIAKMIMERKKDIPDGSKPGPKGRLKVKDNKQNKDIGTKNFKEKMNVAKTHERLDPIFHAFKELNGKIDAFLGQSEKMNDPGEAEMEKIRVNIEAAKEHGGAFNGASNKFATFSSQNEALCDVEKVVMEELGNNVKAVEAHERARNTSGLEAKAECRTTNTEYGQVVDHNDVVMSRHGLTSYLEEMGTGKETLKQKEVSVHYTEGPEKATELAKSVISTSQRTRKLDNIDEASEQVELAVDLTKESEIISEMVERSPNISPSTLVQVVQENVDDVGADSRVSQEDEVIDEGQTETDDLGKHEKIIEEHEEVVNAAHLKLPDLKFDNLMNDPPNMDEQDAMEQEEIAKKFIDVLNCRGSGQRHGKSWDEEKNGMRLGEARKSFESKEHLNDEALAEPINKRDPEAFPETEEVVEKLNTVHEPEIIEETPNNLHGEGGKRLRGALEQNKIDETEMQTFEDEVAVAKQLEGINYAEFQKIDSSWGTNETNILRGTQTSAENQDKPVFPEAACEIEIEAVDAKSNETSTSFSQIHNNNPCTLFSETQEPCEINLDNVVEENGSVAGVAETGKKAKQPFHLEDDDILRTDSLHRSASEDNFTSSNLHYAFEGLSFDCQTENFGTTNTNNEEKLPVDKDTSETTDEIHNTAQEAVDKFNLQNSPEVNHSDYRTAECDLTDVRVVSEQTSESVGRSESTSSLENMDDLSINESEICAENTKNETSDEEEVKDDLKIASEKITHGRSEEEYSEEQREGEHFHLYVEPEDTEKSTEDERTIETGESLEKINENSETSTMEQNCAKENVTNFDKEDQRQRIEAIKKGRAREKDRIAAERAMREARERAFAEAQVRAERAAVERAAAEARQRFMAEAQEKLEKASTAAKPPSDKASTEAKLRSERAAVERATAEARERALEKAMSLKTSTEGRTHTDKCTEKSINNGLKHSFSSSDLEKFDGTSNESAKRSKARLERHQRIMERAAKALAEKNMRDLLAQKEQAERNRLAESLDADIKRWVTGKEGNLRALLSTLQYILGPSSGWQPISLTEIITTPAVKKAYRKATLYVHPDKLQQRGASIQQKYICEKVFDLLKAAWNRFNSEER